MIIHITGPSVSGRKTLENKLSKLSLSNTIVINIHDIVDTNRMKLKSKYTFDKKKDVRLFKKEVEKKNKECINKILKDNKGKNIVFVGSLYGMKHVEKKVEKGFIIQMEPDDLWKQTNLETVTITYKNYNEIKKLLESGMNMKKIYNIFLEKFGLYDGFTYNIEDSMFDIISYLNGLNKYAMDIGYTYTTSENIYSEIVKLLSSKNKN